MLQVHRAERSDRLLDALADVLRVPTDDPFTREVVSVHSRGIERWLAQELSVRLGTTPGRGDGVCANVEFPFPSRLVGRALAAASDVDPERDPWAPNRLVWPLLEVLDHHADADWLAPIRPHLRGDDDGGAPRRYAAARHVADLFDRYAVHRPGMLRAWADERDTVPGGEAVPSDAAWQPRLWREVRAKVGVPSPAERLAPAVERLRDGVAVPGLASRLSLFGLTALPTSYLDVLAALAHTRDVNLFLLHPSPALWEAVAATALPAGRPIPRESDPTRELPDHPILGAWGRDAREMQVVLGTVPSADTHHAAPDDGLAADATLLQRLQHDIRTDTAPSGPHRDGGADPRPVLAEDDRSVQVHACHGRTRQVEVLRDAILHLLAEHPDLEPRDVLVMCPDIETYAPIVHAVFGARAIVAEDAGQPGVDGPDGDVADGTSEGAPGQATLVEGIPDLRVRLADRSIRQTNPVLRVVAELLELADGRVTASQVLDLASREPVRRRFRFDDEDLDRLDRWVEQSGIRWGIDAGHRADHGLDGIAENTWRAGLDRLLLGVTMCDEEDRLVGGTVPLDDVEGTSVDLAGRFVELLDRLGRVLERLRAPKGIGGWREAITEAANALTAVAGHADWQRVQLRRLLDRTVDAAEGPEGGERDVELSLPDVRALLEGSLRGRPTRANHRTGDLTVCTLVPMRSVPHEVVCLLGMDEGAFPRRTASDGDDLIDLEPQVGDRDPRTEDRQLLLDALLAAKRALVVTYTGRDERTNEPLPPAVPIGELLDTVDRTVRVEPRGDDERRDPPTARGRVLVEHPLQSFDARNFAPGELVAGRHWSFDRVALSGAAALVSGERRDAPFLPFPLPPPESREIALSDLVRFLEHPCRAFLRQRLGVYLSQTEDRSSDAIPVELDGLEKWQIGDSLLDAFVAGRDLDRWERAERARGNLPPADLAELVLGEVRATAEALAEVADQRVGGGRRRRTVDVRVELADGRPLVGQVGDVCDTTVLALGYSSVRAKQRLRAWARLLALVATDPGRDWSALTIGRSPKSSYDIRVSCLRPQGGSDDERRLWALRNLTHVVELMDRGLTEPLPVFCETSGAYAEAVADDRDAEYNAGYEWFTGNAPFPKEDRDPNHVLILGGVLEMDDLLSDGALGPAGEDEEGEGWFEGEEDSRFGRYARRLWTPLLEAEECEDLKTSDVLAPEGVS